MFFYTDYVSALITAENKLAEWIDFWRKFEYILILNIYLRIIDKFIFVMLTFNRI